MKIRTLCLGLAVLVAPSGIFLTSSLSAHTHFVLVKSAPADEAILEEPPTTIRLWFSQEPDLAGTRIRLIDHHDEMIEVGPVRSGADDQQMVEAAIHGDASHGGYTIMWRGMAKDGHVVTGEFTFEVEASR